jgi:TetR/AcrR family transcriptional repressor of nem operon
VRYSTDRKAETRARVLKEAAKEIREKGPNGVAVAGIMARAGLTHGAFYAHFASKDALVSEAIDAMFADTQRRTARLPVAGTPREELRDFVSFYLSPAHRDQRDRGCPLPSLSADMIRTEGPAGARFAEGIGAMAARLAGMLERMGFDDAGARSNALLAQLVGAITLARALGVGVASDALLQDTKREISGRYGLDDA